MRIFVAPAQLAAGEVVITGDEHHYLSRVRRARVGDALELVDGAGRRAQATITAIAANETRAHAAVVETASELPPRIRVLLPLIKGDRMDTCLEKLVEVGVDEIVIWPAAHAVVRLDADRLDARIAKFAAALQAASRQSRRATIPAVSSAPSLSAAVAAVLEGSRFVLDPTATTPLPEALSPLISAPHTFASGPEGGLSPEELAAFAAAGFTGVTLGPRTLRAETAPVVAVALLRALTNS